MHILIQSINKSAGPPVLYTLMHIYASLNHFYTVYTFKGNPDLKMFLLFFSTMTWKQSHHSVFKMVFKKAFSPYLHLQEYSANPWFEAWFCLWTLSHLSSCVVFKARTTIEVRVGNPSK